MIKCEDMYVCIMYLFMQPCVGMHICVCVSCAYPIIFKSHLRQTSVACHLQKIRVGDIKKEEQWWNSFGYSMQMHTYSDST